MSTVLIAEDNPDIRSLLYLFLAREGFEVATAADGAAALERISDAPPDVLLTDLGMPRLDGLELIRRVREQEEFADLPIVAMSAYGGDSLRAASQVGATAAIAKPLDVEDLVDTINRALAARPDLN